MSSMVRAYAYLGESGETIWDIGQKTPEEVGCNFFDGNSTEADTDSYWERTDLRYPDEEDVLKISAGWSVDTSFEKEQYSAGNGIIGSIK